jgi:hypothetical protein
VVKNVKIVRKTELAIGILLMLVGVIVSSWSNLSSVTVSSGNQIVLPRGLNQWSLTCSFNKGEKIFFEFPEPTEGPMLLGGFNVSIVADSVGNETVFYYDVLGSGEYNVSVIKNDGALEVDEGSTILGGVTNYAGNYTAYISQIATLWYKGPPSILTFYRVIEEEQVEFPHRNILPLGLAVFLIGLGLSVWAVAFKKTRVSQKRKR